VPDTPEGEQRRGARTVLGIIVGPGGVVLTRRKDHGSVGKELPESVPLPAVPAARRQEAAMSAQQIRDSMQQYAEVLLARGDYGRFFDEDVEFALMGTDQRARGADATVQAIRYLHETAFDAQPEFKNLLVDERGAAAEAVLVGTHTGEFGGVAATGASVNVPYSVFYEFEADKITALRVYMPMEQLMAQIGGVSTLAEARSEV
jgi:predicted ester cyclase